MPAATRPPVVPEDRSLDEFSTAGATDTAADDAAADDAAADTVDAADDAEDSADTAGDDDAVPDLDAVAPAEATYDVSPDGADCAVCGATATRRWRDDPGYVCADCKEW